MKVTPIKCTHPGGWYAGHLGEQFVLLGWKNSIFTAGDRCALVTSYDGTTNYIKEEDCDGFTMHAEVESAHDNGDITYKYCGHTITYNFDRINYTATSSDYIKSTDVLSLDDAITECKHFSNSII